MKTAIYIEDGATQIVLTPDTEWEKKVCKQFYGKKHALEVMEGAFYGCHGGWTRFRSDSPYSTGEDNSLIIRLNEAKETS